VPLSLLNPEGEILMFFASSGVTANFAMVLKFEESANKSTKGVGKMGGADEFPPELGLTKGH
jgi:hypothetical protein